MTAAPDQQTASQTKGQRLVLTGVGLVMGACVFGGGIAIVLYLLNQRPAAMAAAGLAAIAIIAGVVVQVQGARLLKVKAP